MSGLMKLFSGDALIRRNQESLLRTNEITREYGLTLTSEDAALLIKAHEDSLRGNSRVEVGSPAIDRIILAFCDSPYLNEQNYVDTIQGLVELFYYLKNESLDKLSDELLISQMRYYFNGTAGGSLELLADRDMERLARAMRSGEFPEEGEDENAPGHSDSHAESECSDYDTREDDKWRTIQF